jgi:hypothetical protein
LESRPKSGQGIHGEVNGITGRNIDITILLLRETMYVGIGDSRILTQKPSVERAYRRMEAYASFQTSKNSGSPDHMVQRLEIGKAK